MNSRFELLFSVKLQMACKHDRESSPALFLTMKLDSSSQVVVEHTSNPRLKKSEESQGHTEILSQKNGKYTHLNSKCL